MGGKEMSGEDGGEEQEGDTVQFKLSFTKDGGH